VNVVLIGYRGTGKSTVGRLLARSLEFEYLGLDDEIVRRAGRTIPEIVEAEGWDAFRDLEAEVVRESSARDRCVLDTGGGVVLREENMRHLARGGVVFLLVSEIADIVERIQGDSQRPSLTGAKSFTEEVEEVLGQRQPKYRAAAQHVVDTSRPSPEQAVDVIEKQFRQSAAARRS
jgi:shikimate kinase